MRQFSWFQRQMTREDWLGYTVLAIGVLSAVTGAYGASHGWSAWSVFRSVFPAGICIGGSPFILWRAATIRLIDSALADRHEKARRINELELTLIDRDRTVAQAERTIRQLRGDTH